VLSSGLHLGKRERAMYDELKDRVQDLHRRLTHVKDSL